MKSIALFLGCISFLAPAWADDLPPLPSPPLHRPSLEDVFHSLGDLTIPAAWGGIWNFNNNDFECITKVPTGSDADIDTLCTGDVFFDSNLTCTGTADDTNIDVECTGEIEVIDDCFMTFTYTLTANRNGDSLTASSTQSQVFTPPFCAFQPDQCILTETNGTRVAPEPKNCLTAVEEMSWGRVKAVYR
jgi:hypothetical protein